MTVPNHIAGGFVITGTFCSLWSVNIVESPYYLAFTLFGSLLPDIDYPNATMGRLALPISRPLFHRFGHRTITHSLLFLCTLTFSIYLVEKVLANSFAFALIFFFSVFSHILLDMLTFSGVAFFYPFKRNPCVIPGNQNYRIRTGDMRSEGLVLFMFVFLGLSLQNLFKDGFWTTYNANFNDITHVNRQASSTNFLTKIDYHFFDYEKEKKGSGFVVYHSDKQLHIMDKNGSFVPINENQNGLKIKILKALPSNISSYTKSVLIKDLDLMQINRYLNQKYVFKLALFSNSKASLLWQKNIKNGQVFTEENLFSPQFNTVVIDSLKTVSKVALEDKIRELEIMIKAEEDGLYRANSRYYNSLAEIDRLNAVVRNSNELYTINQAKSKIIDLKSYTGTFVPVISKTLEKLKHQLATLKMVDNSIIRDNLLFNGELVYFSLKNNTALQ